MVSRYMSRIFNLFSRSLGDRELAADATQEVFLRVFKESDKFDARRSFKSWIFAIAWNLARDFLRRGQVRRRGVERGGPCRDGGEADEPVDSRERPPLEALERREDQDAVRHALDRLDPRQRALLVLREFEDLSYEELSELLECPVGTIKSGIHRARLDLKNALLALQPWRYS
jgi:RNA polymerase sigma-70 factor (ECF subfamily)